MAVSYVTQANANTASVTVTSKTITIPSVAAGDVLLLVANCYSNASGSSTINISSTGTAWTRQGSSTYVAGTAAQNNGSLFYLTAGASETGKVVTISTAASLYYNLTMVVYRGVALPFDGVQITSSATLTTSDTCPAITTTNSGTWLVCLGSLCNGSAGFSSCTGPALASQVREANFGSASGIAVASDSNGAVAAGSQVPGHFTPSATADYITWSAGLAPASTGTSVNAAIATGTGTAQQPSAGSLVTATAGLANGTGSVLFVPGTAISLDLYADSPVTAGPAAALGATITTAAGVFAGLATAAGTARPVPLANANPGLAHGTGAALIAAPAVGVTAGLAHGTGAALQPSVSTSSSQTVNAGLATGAGTTLTAGTSVSITADFCFGLADAADAAGAVNVPALPGVATGTGTAQRASTASATGTGTARDAAPAAGVSAALATGTATAQPAGQSADFTAGLATGTGAALLIAGTAVSVTAAGLAHGTGAAFNGVISSVVSPVLTASGFGTFSQVPVGAVVLSVIAAIVQHGSNAQVGEPSYELWDGTAARIGTSRFGTASTAAGHTDSVVFTGVSYSQLATLQLRIYATSQAGNTGATVSVDAVSLSVSWAPGQDATAAPAAVTVVPVVLSPAASGTVNVTVAPDVLIIVPVFPVESAGFAAAALFPGALAIGAAVLRPAIGSGSFVTPGVLAVVPAFPGITDVTVPGWATADSSGGDWATPGNITGLPDGSYAVWTVPMTAGLAQGTGAALQPSAIAGNLNVSAGLATGTGTARSVPMEIAPAGLAAGTGTALTAGTSDSITAAGLAAGTGTAQGVPMEIAPAGFATGTGTARQPSITTAGGTSVTAGLAHGAGTALAAAPAAGAAAGLAQGTAGTALAAAPAAGAAAGLAQGTGVPRVPAFAEASPSLELYGFSISGPTAGSTINRVTVAITEYQSNSAQAPCTYELWDYSGTPAQIGTTQTGSASTSSSNTSTAVFTGVTYAMLATLRVRVYGHALSGTGYIESVDGVSLVVNYT